MSDAAQSDRIAGLEALHEHYGEPVPLAVACELDHLDEHHRRFIGLSPFLCLAAAGGDGQPSVSPKGDAPGFVRVVDEHTLVFPDRRGNNKVETLEHLVENPKVAMVFFVPGLAETLRVWGTAEIRRDPSLLELAKANGKAPSTVLVVHVTKAYFHCGKALLRSKLWEPDSRAGPDAFPSFGQVIKDQTRAGESADELQAGVDQSYRDKLY